MRDYLRRIFPAPLLTLPRARQASLIDRLAELGISGGASYDAVIAMVTAHHGRQLVTLVRRARTTYDRIWVSVRELP